MHISIKEPSYSTILLWTKKLGYFQLEKKIKKADDWVIILDESVEFGHDKLLVIYGIQSKNISFKRPLNYEDLTPLLIASSPTWTGEMINKEINKIKQQYGGIIYAVADGGNAIKKGLSLAKIPHVYDITHKFAWFLKELYKEYKEFQSYTKTMAKMRCKLSLSEVSHVLPPNQRFHSRFMNLDIISDWGIKVLNYLESRESEERAYKELLWVKNYRSLIMELSEVNNVLAEIKTMLKTEGMSIKNADKAKTILTKIQIKNGRTEWLKSSINQFLDEMIERLPNTNKFVCTSDIIESSFGKYKGYICNNPMVGITNLALSMAAFTTKIDEKVVRFALENVKVKNKKEWSIENIGETNLQRRQRVLRKAG